jgi:hypothetical protein
MVFTRAGQRFTLHPENFAARSQLAINRNYTNNPRFVWMIVKPLGGRPV